MKSCLTLFVYLRLSLVQYTAVSKWKCSAIALTAYFACDMSCNIRKIPYGHVNKVNNFIFTKVFKFIVR